MIPHGYKRCAGWWQQEPVGRQPMHNLHLNFDGSIVTGSGDDVIAPFFFTGTLRAGAVKLVKQYMPGHRVDYRGEHDGGNRLWGRWNLEGLHGPWEIVILDEGSEERETDTSKELVVTEPH